MTAPTPVLDRIFRDEYGRAVAALIARFGDFDLAEDAVSEAIVVALQKWPRDGLPPNPGGWLTTTAHRKALDGLRREAVGDRKQREAVHLHAGAAAAEDTGPVEDDRLRLVFTCCHPALDLQARIALTLRLVGGLTVAEIARAFLVPERTLAQRITRAKRKITDAHIPYRVPTAGDLHGRLGGVLHVLYLIFNEGYLASEGEGVRTTWPPRRCG